MTIEQDKFPSEVIDMPSHGWFYKQDNPLSTGQIEIKYLTAREEDILTSRNLIQKGVVFDKLLQALIVNKSVNYGDLLIGDKNAIMVAARILAYGKDYGVTVDCPECNHRNTSVVDLTKMTDKVITEPSIKGVNEFDTLLPVSKKTITFKLLSHDDETNISDELKSIEKSDGEVSHELTTRLKYIILAIDGTRDKKTIKDFIDKEMLARDSRAFREAYAKQNPELDMIFDFVCSACDARRKMPIPIGIDFFWPSD